MQKLLSEFSVNRIEQIAHTLHKTNAPYALATERIKALWENINPILSHERSITISPGDCLNLRECFEQQAQADGILREELYRQGYRDCVQLLAALGVLA